MSAAASAGMAKMPDPTMQLKDENVKWLTPITRSRGGLSGSGSGRIALRASPCP